MAKSRRNLRDSRPPSDDDSDEDRGRGRNSQSQAGNQHAASTA